MPSLKDIKVRITSVKKTQQITKAMKMVAASKMKRATDSIVNARPYAQKLQGILNNLQYEVQNHFNSDDTKKRESKAVLLIVIAADKGLCGGFNSTVRKQTSQLIKNYRQENCQVKVMAIGRKAYEFCRKLEVDIVYHQINFLKDLNFSHAVQIMNHAKKMYDRYEVDSVKVIFNRFVNAITQKLEVEQVLPIVFPEKTSKEKTIDGDYIFEPSRIELMIQMIPKHLNFHIWKALLESNAAEQAARMMAMENATNNAGEIIKKLRLTYNKLRQANITREIAEIVGGAAALQS